MRKYREVARIYFKTQIAFRVDILFQMLFTVSKLLFAYLLWGTIFQEKSLVAGFTLQGMLSYYLVSAFLSQLDMSASLGEEISARIRNGTFSNYVVLPVQLQGYFVAQQVGVMSFYLVFDLLATLVWVVLFGIEFVLTTSISLIVCALFMAILGLFFMIQLNFFLGILTLRFEEISTFLMIKNNLISLINGSIVPLVLFPETVVKLMKCLPFYYVSYLPAMLFTGRCQEEASIGLGVLAGWCVVMQVVIARTWSVYRKKYEGVGA